MQTPNSRRSTRPANSPASEETGHSRIDHRLIAKMDKQEVEDFLLRWKSSKAVREVIVGVLTADLEAVIIKSESEGILESPNALAAIADLNGYRRGLRAAINLLTQQDSV